MLIHMCVVIQIIYWTKQKYLNFIYIEKHCDNGRESCKNKGRGYVWASLCLGKAWRVSIYQVAPQKWFKRAKSQVSRTALRL